jgi:predicted RecB family nuclease
VHRVQTVDGVLVVSPTDLTRFASCRHLTRLDLEVARGTRPAPPQPGEELELLFARGLDHEAAYLRRLREQGLTVVEIPAAGRGADGARLRELEALTVEAMASGAEVVYQGTFFDGRWRGHADFLLRRDDRPGRWAWSYDVADTKLSRRLKVAALLQMAVYAERLTQLQHLPPEQLVVVTGDRVARPYRFDECAAYATGLRAELLAFLDAGAPGTRPEPVPHCGQCRWEQDCRRTWRAQDDLSLVAGMRRSHALTLRAAGIETVEALGSIAPQDVPGSMNRPVAERLAQQARLQLTERRTGRPVYELLPPQAERGLSLLPEPSEGDVFFDMEGDPFVGDHGLEYLFGLVERGEFTAYWATDPADEQQAFEHLVDHLIAAWDRDPGMHVYHYAPYEPTRLKALSGRYDTRIAELDRLLRGRRLVDLYTVVKQGVRVGKESYSIKKLEDFYWGHGRSATGVSDAMGSVVAFEKWVLDADPALLEQIRSYNEDDCRSTQALRDWLEALRGQALEQFADIVASHPLTGEPVALQRPSHGDGAPSAAVAAVADETAALHAALLATLPEPAREESAARSPDQQAVWLLAMLLDWHRRESLPQWWEYYHRFELTQDELVADPAAVAGLRNPVQVGVRRQSLVWRMEFDPQDTKLAAGAKQWQDPVTGLRPGEVVEVRPDEGWLTLTRSRGSGAPRCTALVPGGPVPSVALAHRLRDLGRWVLAHGVDHDDPGWRAARDLLLGRPPRLGPTQPQAPSGLRLPGEPAAEAVSRLARALADGVLPVQGPPGTGKTYAGARMVLDLLAEGRRVGVCAFSHRAIGNLLVEIADEAKARGVSLAALQKAGPDEACGHPGVETTDLNAVVDAGLATAEVTLVAGTAWLFARAELAGKLDVLVVDEAGQLSLANVLAISHAASNLVLLGDPQQLAQPVVGVHPTGAQASALEHLIAGRPTIPPDRGILLDTTYRMHPDVARFVSWLSYEGRLEVAPGRDRQRVHADGLPAGSPLAGTGLRWLAVPHSGNASVCVPEAELAAALVAELLTGEWTDDEGLRRRLTPRDVMVLAPYNQQVHRIRQALRGVPGADEVRVGTVDMFQGQQAAVVLYSLASSSAADAPRGTDFLFSPNRLTVALSRGRAVVAVLGSPALLTSPVSTPGQLRRVNALCAFAEAAAQPQVLSRPAAPVPR